MTITTDKQGKPRKGEGTTDGGEWVTPPRGENTPGSLTRGVKPKYVAPDVAVMRKTVIYRGQTTTWGEILNEMDPAGTEVMLSTPRASKLSLFVSNRDENDRSCLELPAAVAKASGLTDITPPLDRAQAELSAAQNALDNYESRLPVHMMLTSTKDEKRSELKVNVAQAEWDLDTALNSVAGSAYEKGGDELVEAILAGEGKYGFKAGCTRMLVHAALADEKLALKLLEHRDPSGGNPFRRDTGEQARHAILDHESPKVRAAAVRNGLAGDNASIVQQYIGRYPQQAVLDAANEYWKTSGKTGSFSFTSGDEKILFDDRDAGTRMETDIRSLAGMYKWRLASPRERHERRVRTFRS